jgi:hypothetical protein
MLLLSASAHPSSIETFCICDAVLMIILPRQHPYSLGLLITHLLVEVDVLRKAKVDGGGRIHTPLEMQVDGW